MLEPKAMKIISPAMCPHCQKEIIVNQSMVTPIVSWILKREDIEKAKKTVKDEILKSKLEDSNKAEIVAWLDNKETMFGPDEVNTLLAQLIPIKEEKK